MKFATKFSLLRQKRRPLGRDALPRGAGLSTTRDKKKDGRPSGCREAQIFDHSREVGRDNKMDGRLWGCRGGAEDWAGAT
jgi:hypothetical protein